MIEILLKNGNYITYKPDEYTDYMYDRKCFVVLYNKQWIGFFNIDSIDYIMIDRKSEKADE